MQFFTFALAALVALVTAEEQGPPQCHATTVTSVVYMTNKPIKHHRHHHRPCPPVNCAVCPYQKGDLFVLKDKVPFYKAECACNEHGGVLAAINSANFANATEVEFNCVGANSYAWIKSWNTDNYHNACLALFTGNQNGGGAISVPVSCDNAVPVICQKYHQQCDKPDQCHEFIWEWTESESDDCPCRPHDRECNRWWSSSSSSSSSSSDHHHQHQQHHHHRGPHKKILN